MVLHKRALTVNFQRAVNGRVPVVMEVAVNPLAHPSSPALDATLVELRSNVDVLLTNEVNTVIFQLVPTDHPDLDERVTYRIAWREKYMGRISSTDFVMPDADVDFDDLRDLSLIIGGETYLQWTDAGVPNGVARLDSAGRVIDGEGHPVSGAESAAVVQGNLEAESVLRQQGDNFLRAYFLQFASDQITQVYTSTAASLAQAVGQLQNADTTEKAQRQLAVATLNSALASLQTNTNNQIAALNDLIDDVEGTLSLKADLVGGQIPSSQLPDVALGRAVPVADQAEMLALTSSQVQPGDFAVRPDGIYFLNANPPSVLGNWVRFQVSATVLTVNGQTGAVVLGAADVGARSSSVPVPFNDVSGLSSAFALKADASVVTAINNRLITLENDSTIVRTSSGTIPRSVMGTFLAYINTDGQVTRKDGTVLNLGGGGGDLDIDDVTGLVAALASKVDTTDPALTNPRTPVAHAASHAAAGSDPITPAAIGARASATPVPIADITGLQAILTNNGLTPSSDLDGRVGSLETRVDDLETSGVPGGGGGGTSAKTTSWQAVAPTTDLTTVSIKSPFGFDGTDYYYDPAGAADGEAVFPYITPNGHLKLVARNEANPVDEPLATQDALDVLQALVDTKANSDDLDITNAAVDTKASLSALSSLQAVVDTKATIAALNAANDTLALKANQSALDSLTTTVGTKASQASLDGLSTTVGTKANTSALNTLADRVTATETGKADLSGGTVLVGQIPTLPQTKITNLVSNLAAKADLSGGGGTVPLTQLPNYPTSKVTGLDTTLALKADLVGGYVPASQMPNLAFSATYVVANRPAMLALTTSQVQPGDVAVISDTVDKGSYILNSTDPTIFSNWVRLVAPDDSVTSVNGQTGPVVLGPADVGARSSATPIAQAEVTGLSSSFAAKADVTALTTGLAGKTSPTDVQALVNQGNNKVGVDYVATSSITLSGPQSVDGTLLSAGLRVLVTAQSSSVANGIYITAAGSTAWSRATDMPVGDFFSKGSVVVVYNGNANASSVWQLSSNSGVVGTAANNWTKILTAGAPPVYTAVNGVQKIGNEFSGKAVAGGGLQVVAGGFQRDPNFLPGKYAADVPPGSAVVTITHNLNTTDVSASFRDKTSGDAVLVGWKPTGVNTISAEFATAPSSGQYRVTVIG